MNNLTQIKFLTMTSREIAELTGKRHDHVLRDIDVLLKDVSPELGRSIKSTTYIDKQGREYRQYDLDFRATMLVVTGYNGELRLRVIDRWQELENTNTTVLPLNTNERKTAICILEDELKLNNLLTIPLHLSQIEAIKEVKKLTNIDFSEKLKLSTAQQNIIKQDIMLEPTELALQLNFKSAISINKKLFELGLQNKINNSWEPTESGKLISSKHSWIKGTKSGYNLKWNLDKIKELIK